MPTKNKGTNQFRDIIDKTIEEILKMPGITSDDLGIDTNKIKRDLIPQLQKQKERLNDFDRIEDNIAGIRNEIIEPVNQEIRKNSSSSRKLNFFLGTFSIIGAILTIYGLLRPNLDSSAPLPKETKTQTVSKEKITDNPDNTLSNLSNIFSGSKECYAFFEEIRNNIKIINEDVLGDDNQKIIQSRDNLLMLLATKANLDCEEKLQANGLMDEIYQSLAIACFKTNSYNELGELIANYNTLDYDKQSDIENTIRILLIEKEFIESQDEKKYVEELTKMKSLKGSIISPETFQDIPLKNYVTSRISSAKSRIEKKEFEIWVYDAPKIKGSPISKYIQNLKDQGYKKVIRKGNIKGDWEIPFIYYRDTNTKNSNSFKNIRSISRKFGIYRNAESFTQSNYAQIRNSKNINDLKIVIL